MILLASLQFPVVLQFLYPKHRTRSVSFEGSEKARIDKMPGKLRVALWRTACAWFATVATVASACPIQNDLQRGEISLPTKRN